MRLKHYNPKVFVCGALRRGFGSRLHEVFFGVILVPKNNTECYVQT